MTINYPGGGAYTPTDAALKPRQPKERKEKRISAPGENSQFAVRQPPKDSPLRRLSAMYGQYGWDWGYIKYPCTCENWQNRGCNAISAWKVGQALQIHCVCEVRAMSDEQMKEVAA